MAGVGGLLPLANAAGTVSSSASKRAWGMEFAWGRVMVGPPGGIGDMVTQTGASVWWPQLDNGIYLADFLEYRWGKVKETVAA